MPLFWRFIIANSCCYWRTILLAYNPIFNARAGDYDTYVRTRAELEENQMKKYRWEQEQIANMKDYIARFGHGSAKLARQAQSKEKVLAKMVREGLTEKVENERVVKFNFMNVGKLPPPVLQFSNVKFGYSPDKVLYSNVELGVDLDSRVALVGPNGCGKSTLLKLMVGDLEPLDGMVKRHNHLRIGQYHQHLTELLPMEMSPLEYMVSGCSLSLHRQTLRHYSFASRLESWRCSDCILCPYIDAVSGVWHRSGRGEDACGYWSIRHHRRQPDHGHVQAVRRPQISSCLRLAFRTHPPHAAAG